MAEAYRILSSQWKDHALLDCGNGLKLEQFGSHTLVRSEPKAWWEPRLDDSRWHAADARYYDNGSWKIPQAAPRSWHMRYGGVTLEARMTDMSKHVGVFPEQEPHWSWIRERLSRMSHPRVLNLFGYTGAATLVAAEAGAQVTHVDASKPALAWARRNQELSGMQDAPVRWLLDDAFRFVEREIRRGRQYEAILLDPPSFGRGPKGEIWKVEQQIVQLLRNLRALLAPGRGMLVLTLYNLEASALMLKGLVEDTFPDGNCECGELVLPVLQSNKQLPLSLFTRWERD